MDNCEAEFSRMKPTFMKIKHKERFTFESKREISKDSVLYDHLRKHRHCTCTGNAVYRRKGARGRKHENIQKRNFKTFQASNTMWPDVATSSILYWKKKIVTVIVMQLLF